MKSTQRYIFLSVFFISSVALAQNLDALVQQFVTNKQFGGAKISLMAIDITNKDTLIAYKPTLAVPTASTTKLFSSSMALEVLGGDYKFETQFFANGLIANGVLKGDLWVRGGGDVSFGSKYILQDGKETQAFSEIIDSLRAHGILKIQGKIILDGSSFGYNNVPSGWSANDIGNYYGAFPAAFNYYDNVVKYYFETGKVGTLAKLIKTYPNQPNLSLNCKIVSADIGYDNSNIKGKAYDENRSATGKLPANKESYVVRGSVANPESNFMHAMNDFFTKSSFNVSGGIHSNKTLKYKLPDFDSIARLFNVNSVALKEITSLTNHRSINLFAEGLLNGVAYKLTGIGTTSKGIEIYKKFYGPRIDTTGLILYDGSGLSRNNRISASHLCSLLAYMTTSNAYEDFFNSLPIAGVNGTISDLCKGKAGDGKVHAKSGTMTGIKSYSGYIKALHGHDIVFAFIVSGHSCNQNTVIAQMEILLNALASR